MCPASAMQMVGIEEAINPSIETGTLETDNSSFKYNSTGLEANHINVSSCNDVEQLYPQINQYIDKIYGETFYTETAITATIFTVYGTIIYIQY